MIGDPFDGRLENGAFAGAARSTPKRAFGEMLPLLEQMQRRGEVLKPNLVVCASSEEESDCSGATVFARRSVGAASNSINSWWRSRRCERRSRVIKANPTGSSRFTARRLIRPSRRVPRLRVCALRAETSHLGTEPFQLQFVDLALLQNGGRTVDAFGPDRFGTGQEDLECAEFAVIKRRPMTGSTATAKGFER
jgi:hypothetical protein